MGTPEHNDTLPEHVEAPGVSPDERADPAEIAFESVFESVSSLYRVSGRIFHQLIGLEFRSGRAHDAHIEIVKAPERAGVLIERMARRWGAVAQVRVAERLPENVPGLPHPERRSLILIEIHIAGAVASACCRVNQATREIARTALAIKRLPGSALPVAG